MLDLHVRRRLAQNPKIEICDQMEVLGLLHDANETRITGVLISPRAVDSDRRVAQQLPADLVVDATGRASRASHWLKDLGYEPPQETVINGHIGYASRLYRVPENFNGGWTCAYLQAAPPQRQRGAILFRVEGDRWLVTLTGGGRDYPPSDEEGFLQFADSLPVSIIADAIRSAEPVGPIRTHRATENRVRRFESARNLPESFIAIGDAACAFNPVYGQGMTIAALGALTLRQCLNEQRQIRQDGSLQGLARRFQKQLAKVNKAPWLMATGEDYRYEGTTGGSPGVMTKFMHWYMDRVLRLATRDVAVRDVLLHVFSMILAPSALFRRRIVLGVLREAIRPAAVAPLEATPRARRKVLYEVEPRYGRETSGRRERKSRWRWIG
jgi:2-polyprenyl-6-methoxyphenol hydroxylase-like FAD-dependent oxidoreductase